MRECLENVRKKQPLIHSITNYVTANDVANVLLACGASPIMADDVCEAEEITAGCAGLNLNLGTPNPRKAEAMKKAGKLSNQLGHIVLLDPVGAGASSFRKALSAELLKEIKFDAVRGNISEIRALALGSGGERGVDAASGEHITEENLSRMVDFVKQFSRKTGSVIAVTGEIDLVADGDVCYVIRNGRPEMSLVTGTGCQLSAIMTAFLAANPERRLLAAAAAVCMYGVAGETAWRNLKNGEGTAAYRSRIIDAVSFMDGKSLEEGARYEIR